MTTMIDAKGWNATFTHEQGRRHSAPLVCWMLDSGKLVGYFLTARGRIDSAESMSNFSGYERDEEGDAAIVPAEPGWWMVERDSDDPQRGFWSKILAWRISHDGYGVKAIAEPWPDGMSEIGEAEEDKLQFVFDPTRQPGLEGPWPAPRNHVDAADALTTGATP